MGRKPIHSPDEKLKVVLTVLRGEMTQVEIARRLELPETTISKAKQFTEGGREARARATTRGALRASGRPSSPPRSTS